MRERNTYTPQRGRPSFAFSEANVGGGGSTDILCYTKRRMLICRMEAPALDPIYSWNLVESAAKLIYLYILQAMFTFGFSAKNRGLVPEVGFYAPTLT